MSTFSLATNSSCNMHIAHGGDVHLRDKFITDLNNGKWDNESLDPYCAEFVTLAKESTRPVADLGVGNGFTTKKLLETGARVVANDLKTERLEEISRSLNADERGRLTLAPGDALQLVIPSASLGGILATRWINVLRPYECRLLMNDFYRWLAPGGILCITAHTPYSNTTKEAVDTYQHRKYIGDEWPGVVTEDMLQESRRGKLWSNDWIYGYDPDILAREAILAGFKVKKCSFYGTRYVSTDEFQDDACNLVGIIARK